MSADKPDYHDADLMLRVYEMRRESKTREARDADLVLGGGVQFGGPTAAEVHGVPYRFVAYCPIVFPSAEYPPFTIERRVRSPRLNRGLWRLFLGVTRALLGPMLNRRRSALGLAPIHDFYAYLRSPRGSLPHDPGC